ncbi:MAG: M28 family peptidase [Hymenobacter sp.]
MNGQTYRNVLGSFGPAAGPRLVVGAHYDVCGDQPGADDNGTGVAALLELARLLGQQASLPYHVELVAYTLEEPPFFRTTNMGSFRHAQRLHRAARRRAWHGGARNAGLLRRLPRLAALPPGFAKAGVW